MSPRGPRWKRQGAGIVGFVSLLVGVSADHACAQGTSDVGAALMNLFKGEAPRGDAPQPSPVPLSRPGPAARESPAQGPDLVLVGVVITGDKRMALLQDRAGGADRSRLLQLGDTFGRHRLTDVKPDRVTLEGRGGEQMIVRLGGGMSTGDGLVRAAVPAPIAASSGSASTGVGGATPDSDARRLGGAEPPNPGDGVEGSTQSQETRQATQETRQPTRGDRKATDAVRQLERDAKDAKDAAKDAKRKARKAK